jgi:GGDEF domain-containing protein
MRKLRGEMHRRMLGNGYCARPVEMDCHFESTCEGCTFFVATIEFRPTLQAQRDDAARRGQVARKKIFDGLLDRLGTQASYEGLDKIIRMNTTPDTSRPAWATWAPTSTRPPGTPLTSNSRTRPAPTWNQPAPRNEHSAKPGVGSVSYIVWCDPFRPSNSRPIEGPGRLNGSGPGGRLETRSPIDWNCIRVGRFAARAGELDYATATFRAALIGLLALALVIDTRLSSFAWNVPLCAVATAGAMMATEVQRRSLSDVDKAKITFDYQAVWVLPCAVLAGGIQAVLLVTCIAVYYQLRLSDTTPADRFQMTLIIAVPAVFSSTAWHLIKGTAPVGGGGLAIRLVLITLIFSAANWALVIARVLACERRLAMRSMPHPSTWALDLSVMAFATLAMNAAVVSPMLMLLAVPVCYLMQHAMLHPQLHDEVGRDPKTGLWNQRGFGEAATALLARASRVGLGVAVLMLDVDDFKRVNDEYGHPTGDQVLIAVARRLEQCARSGDVLGRFGGEEFVALVLVNQSDDVGQIAAGRVVTDCGNLPILPGGSWLARGHVSAVHGAGSEPHRPRSPALLSTPLAWACRNRAKTLSNGAGSSYTPRWHAPSTK